MKALLLALWIPSTAWAVPPLVQAAEVADVGLAAYWRDKDFIVGRPDDPGRPAVRPLVGPGETTLPPSLTGWTRIGETCEGKPSATSVWDAVPLEARVDGTTTLPTVSVYSTDRLVARQALGKPVTVCALVIAEADALPGPEVIVAWQMDEVKGFTVFHVPETVK